MPFSRTGKHTSNVVISTEKNSENSFENTVSNFNYSNTQIYSDLDSKSNVIFVPTTTDFDLTFSRSMNVDTIKVQTGNFDASPRLKHGSVTITHIVNPSVGGSDDTNNVKGFKNSSNPISIDSSKIDSDPDIKNVEMVSQPSTFSSNTSFNFLPVTRLSSNTTYFLNISKPDIKDEDNVTITFEQGKGFTTDNSRSIVTTNDYYSGFSCSIERLLIPSCTTEAIFSVIDQMLPTQLFHHTNTS